MSTKPGRVVTCNEELPSIKSHEPLITWSSNFDFSYTVCSFRTQTPKSLRLLVAFAYKAKRFGTASFFFFCQTFPEYWLL